VAKKPQFWANFDIWGTPVPNTVMRVKFCVLEETQDIHLHTKFHVNVFFVLASAAQNNFGQILTFGGSCTELLLPMRAEFGALEQTQDLRLTAKFHLDRFILSPSFDEKPNFAVFWNSAFCGVASWRQPEEVEHRCTATNLPLSNGIEIVSILQRLHGEIGRTNSDFHKRDG